MRCVGFSIEYEQFKHTNANLTGPSKLAQEKDKGETHTHGTKNMPLLVPWE